MAQLNQLLRSFNKQAGEIRPEGYILQGSVMRRNLQRKVGDASRTYGPYYLWTRKIDNKTVTQALTAEQAKTIAEAIQCNGELERRLKRLRLLSEQIVMAISPGVVKRNRK